MSTAELTSRLETQPRTPAEKMVLPYRKAAALSLLLVAAVIALYYPIVHHPFANMDDMGYVYENRHVQAGLTWSTIEWSLRTFDDSNWHPLTWMSHALDCQFFGINPAGHHAMNMVWHAIDAVVLFWVLLQATGFLGRSFMVAALFALHPINVESVAWASERKTLLSTFFFLLALAAYRWYAQRPRVVSVRYALVAALFALGLMAKPQIITLPCVLLLWDYWPLGRMFPAAASQHGEATSIFPSRTLIELVTEKIPLLFLCAASALATIKAQHVAHTQSWPYSGWIRVGNSIVAYVRYLGKAIWPSRLAIMYLHPGNSLKFWQVAVSALLLLGITLLVIAARRFRYLPVGWFWFLGTLVPTIGLIQVGRQALADRYAYQSFLGLFFIVCWGLADWAKQKHLAPVILPSVSVLILIALSVMTYRQVGYWKDNLTMWSHALQVTENNWVAEDMVAGILSSQGHQEEAMAHYRAAAAVAPEDERSNLAVALYEQQHGNLQEAIRHYQVAIASLGDPLEKANAYQNMGVAYRDLGDSIRARECFYKAIKLRGH